MQILALVFLLATPWIDGGGPRITTPFSPNVVLVAAIDEVDDDILELAGAYELQIRMRALPDM